MGSTYVQNPPYFEGLTMTPRPGDRHHRGAHPGHLRRLDHHRPHQSAGNIRKSSPAGEYLSQHQVSQADFNSYGAPARATTK